MVFIQRLVQPVGELAPVKVPEGYPRDNTLDLAAQRTMVGLLQQMVVLSSHAADMFTDIMTEANATFSKLADLGGRIDKLHSELPEVEKYFSATPLDTFCSTARADFHVSLQQSDSLFRPETKPKCIAETYEQALNPPNLTAVDPYMEPGPNGEPISALSKYTNPNFFIESWVQEMARQREEAKKVRAERKKRRPAKVGQANTRRQVRTVKKKRFDPLTGELIIEEVPAEPNAPPAASSSPPPQQQQQAGMTSFVSSGSSGMGAPTTPRSSAAPQAPAAPAAPSFAPPSLAAPQRMPSAAQYAPPPPPPGMGAAPAPPPPPPAAPQMPISKTSSIKTLPGSAPAPPPPPPPPPPPSGGAGGPPPPPPPPPAGGAGGPPPPPPPPSSGGAAGGMSGGLGAAIAAGASGLKPVTAQIAVKKVDVRSDLMSSILQGGARLKAVGQPAPGAKKPATTTSNSVAAILARRIAVADSDDEGEEEDDAWSD